MVIWGGGVILISVLSGTGSGCNKLLSAASMVILINSTKSLFLNMRLFVCVVTPVCNVAFYTRSSKYVPASPAWSETTGSCRWSRGSVSWLRDRLNTDVYIIFLNINFSLYLTENTVRLSCRDQSLNDTYGNKGCLLYSYFWVLPRRQKFIFRRFGTHAVYSILIGGVRRKKIFSYVHRLRGWNSVFRNVGI